MRPSRVYWLAALLCLAAPLLAVGAHTSLTFLYVGAVPLSVLSLCLGFTSAVHGREDSWETVVAIAWLVGASSVCVPLVVLTPSLPIMVQVLGAAGASGALLVAGIRGLRSETPALPRLTRVASLVIAALLLARAGLRAYVSMESTTSQGIAALMAEAQLFAVVALMCAVGLCVSAADEMAWRRPA